jgi:MFS family permease
MCREQRRDRSKTVEGSLAVTETALHESTGISSRHYKWVVLSNTTLGTFMALMNASVVIISLPAIFRGIHVQPLDPGNTGLLLWMLQGYLVVTAVLVVTFGRIGDIFGRVKLYNLGFLVFTVASIGLSLSPFTGTSGALVLIGLRVVQGVGGALLMANSTAILTDAFEVSQRGMALGLNVVAGISGSFLGLIVGGVMSTIDWRLVFLVSVPFGIIGTIWAYVALHETAELHPAKIDWWGNLTFGVGLVLVLIALTYGIQPYGGHSMGWTSPFVLGSLIGGLALLATFLKIEQRVDDPLMHLELFRNRAFAGGGIAMLFANMGRGGLQFLLIIWLQGIWLPLHGYDFIQTPLWSSIYLIPLSVGFLAAGPVSGTLSDRIGQKWPTTLGMALTAVTFFLLIVLPVNFPYPLFAVLLLLNGIGTGAFSAPNASMIMNSVPASKRGAASGIRATFMNSGFVLSIGLFFSLMVIGLASALPAAIKTGLVAQGVSPNEAAHVAALPPVGILFAAFLGYNPLSTLLGASLHQLTAAQQATITSRWFFPHLISGAFHSGLVISMVLSGLLCAIAALTSWWAGSDPAVQEIG